MGSLLFEPFKIGNLSLKNRFVRSATHDFIGNSDGSLSEDEFRLYESLAANHVGLIITAHAYVQHPLGRASINQNALYDDRFVEGYDRLAKTVHRHGSKLILQISHAGRQLAADLAKDHTALGPSAVEDKSSGIIPREMNGTEIEELIRNFTAAMLRAQQSGCDGVQLHIAHGYLLSQFISPYTNRRTDLWGGNTENRCRIITEIIKQGRRLVGKGFPILAKLNSTDGFFGAGYLSIDDVVQTATLLEKAGLDAIELSGGIREAKDTMSRTGIRLPEQEAYFSSAALAVKQALHIPVILVGGIRSQGVMEALLQQNNADLIALSRPFIRQPNLISRFIDGAKQADCISCNACFNPQGGCPIIKNR